MPPIAHERVGEYVRSALSALLDNGGSLRRADVFSKVSDLLEFDDYELTTYEKTGRCRWMVALGWQSLACVKSGWLTRSGGTWHLTSAGEAALQLSDIELYMESEKGYSDWKKDQVNADSYQRSEDPELWSAFTKWAELIFQWDQFDATERDYKLQIAENLVKAREAFLARQEGWEQSVRTAFGPPNNLTTWRVHRPFLQLIGDNSNAAERVLHQIWRTDANLIDEANLDVDSPAKEKYFARLKDFVAEMSRIGESSAIRFTMLEVLGSFLLMALNPSDCPIYRADPINQGYKLTGEPPPLRGSDPPTRYKRAMEFLSDVIDHCESEGVNLRDMVDAQSIVWSITKGTAPDHWDEQTKSEFAAYRGEQRVVTSTIDDTIDYWVVSPFIGDIDQTRRFVDEGIWENTQDLHIGRVRDMKQGDRIALRTRSAQSSDLPFDNLGHSVSKITIRAIGTITSNPSDGRIVHVDWEEVEVPRDWYFYTFIGNVWRLPREVSAMARRLISFIFYGESQDYNYFCDQWWGSSAATDGTALDEEIGEFDRLQPYSNEDVAKEGVFLSLVEIDSMVRSLETKRNVILQGAPGVGKTFLARKLAYALMGWKDDSRITTVQLHPSYSYEDFVRGYRPTDEAGRFELQDGPFLRVCEQAYGDPDNRHVMIIDEINRGNLSQVFGEMFSLLESDKRGKVHEVTPLFRRGTEDRLSVPENLYVIGTMNIADRSLALVDYALRRRFAFIRLEPRFQDSIYTGWLLNKGMDPDLVEIIVDSMTSLNDQISEDRQLGKAYQIGHSFFCPSGDDFSELGRDWFASIIDTEIRPLIEEYWFDEPDKVDAMMGNLIG